MQKTTLHIFRAFILSWIIGIACLFIALQFSPPRWSLTAMRGALSAAAESSMVYVLPPLLILLLLAARRVSVSTLAASVVAFLWVVLAVAWWASSFSPVPWAGVLRNVVILLPGSLVPSLAFHFLLGQRKR